MRSYPPHSKIMDRASISKGASRYGIVSARMERMTFQYPSERQPSSLDHPVFFDRFIGVFRTAGLKPAARREERRYPAPVEQNQK